MKTLGVCTQVHEEWAPPRLDPLAHAAAQNKHKKNTSVLKGVKIGIMGCVVNGPGEMADVDFGYVGSGSGKISLYKGHNCVRKNIPEEKAVDYLIDLIREHGMWQDQTKLPKSQLFQRALINLERYFL